jgi:adenylate kinase
MEGGELVPDRLIIKMFLDKLNNSKKNLFFDGFPRTVGQAQAMLDAGVIPDFVIELKVEEEVIIARSRDRLVCSGCGERFTQTRSFKRSKKECICDKCGKELQRRKDDADERVVRNRLRVYEQETRLVLGFLKGAGVSICTIDNSSEDAGEKFKELIGK